MLESYKDGTVIRWVSSGVYAYVAVKAGTSWYTSATRHNTRTPQVVGSKDLENLLNDPEVSNIETATAWEGIPI